MGRPVVRGLAVVAAVVVVSVAGTIWVVGPSDTFRKARAAERVRETFDALSLLERDALRVQAAHRSLMLIADTQATREYEAQRTVRNRRLDSIANRSTTDSLFRRQLTALGARFAEADAFRDRVFAVSTRSRDSVAVMLRSADAEELRRNTLRDLSALETEQRRRLAALQPVLDRQRDWLAIAIPASLAIVTAILGWLFLALTRERARASDRAAQYRRTLDDSPDAAMIHRNGIVLFANHEAAKMFGAQSEQDLEGRRILDLVFEEDRDAIRQRIREAQQGGRLPARLTRMTRLDGSVIEAETRGAAVEWNGLSAAQVTLRDVSALRRSELALAQSEKRFRTVLDTIDEGIVLQDENLAIHLTNPAAERILGMSGAQMSGRTSLDPGWMAIDENGDPLPGERHFAPIALRTGRQARGTMGVRRGDGSRVWIDVIAVPMIRDGESRPYAVVATFTDVTVSRETTRRLAQSEARYRLVAENTVDLVALRASDDRLLYASPSHKRILGWEPEELEGRSGLDILHPDDITALRSGSVQLFRDSGSGSATVRLRHRDGHYVWVEVVAAPIAVTDGVVTTHAVSARDITERRRFEESLRQAQKMESMGRMASGIAHDFNNLLTAIRGSAELLGQDANGNRIVQEGIGEILDGVDRAASLTAHLLSFSRGQQTSPELVDCADTLERNRALLSRIVSPHASLEIVIDTDEHPATIFADRTQFEQVLFNLVTNARDAAPAGGTVRVRLSGETTWSEVSGPFGVLLPNRYVVLTVEDDGTGIPDDVMPHLFEPFFTTKPQGRGTGLGLATVFGIAQHHAGAVTAVNREDGGARFTVYWPQRDAAEVVAQPLVVVPERAAAPADDTRPMRRPVTPARASTGFVGKTILLVDDEPSVRRTVAKLLEVRGFTVLQAASGQEAIRILSDPAMHVEALVTDVKMPGMTGVELVEALFVERIDLPVLFISGQIDDPIPRDWPSGSPRHFLRKPFRSSELTEEMKRLLGAD